MAIVNSLAGTSIFSSPCAVAHVRMRTPEDNRSSSSSWLASVASCRTAYTSETAREQLSDDYEWNRPPEEAETQAPPRSSGAGCVDFLDLF